MSPEKGQLVLATRRCEICWPGVWMLNETAPRSRSRSGDVLEDGSLRDGAGTQKRTSTRVTKPSKVIVSSPKSTKLFRRTLSIHWSVFTRLFQAL